MQLVMIFLLLLIISPLRGEVSPPGIEEIFQAMQAHMNSIKTAKGKFKIERVTYEKEGDKNTLVIGEYLYKDGHWRMKLKGKEWGEWVNYHNKELQKTHRAIATNYEKDVENKGNIEFDYIEKHRNASVSKKMIDNPYISSYGLFFSGILSANYLGTPISNLRERLENQTCKITVTMIPGTSIIQLAVKYLNKEGKEESTGVIEISPTQQYSILKEEFKESNFNYVTTGHVEMELINPPGIYFPKKAVFEIKQGEPLKTKAIKKFEFSETRLNEEILDAELELILPAGVLVQDAITQEIYETTKETKLEQILAGELEPVLKKEKLSEEDLKRAKELAEADRRKSEMIKKLVSNQNKLKISLYQIILGLCAMVTVFFITFKFLNKGKNA